MKIKNIIKNGINLLNKEAKILITAFSLALVATAVMGVSASAQYAEKMQSGIAESVIRFHCLANSNSEEDQALKLLVREEILKEINPLIEGLESKEAVKRVIAENLNLIKETAEKEIRKNNYNYNVKVSIENFRFPLRKYGSVTFPAGNYDALRVEIGKAAGENFWCVMYPPLCFVDEAMEDIDEKSNKELRQVLTTEEYDLISKGDKEIKFKVVEWWQERN